MILELLRLTGPDNGPGRRYRPTGPAPSGSAPRLPRPPTAPPAVTRARSAWLGVRGSEDGWSAHHPTSPGPLVLRPRCAPAKGWAGGRRPLGSFFPIPGRDRPGCGTAAPPDLPAEKPEWPGLPHHPLQPPPTAAGLSGLRSPPPTAPVRVLAEGGGSRDSAGHPHPRATASGAAGAQHRGSGSGEAASAPPSSSAGAGSARSSTRPPALPALAPALPGARPCSGTRPWHARDPGVIYWLTFTAFRGAWGLPLLIFMNYYFSPLEHWPFFFPHEYSEATRCVRAVTPNMDTSQGLTLDSGLKTDGWLSRWAGGCPQTQTPPWTSWIPHLLYGAKVDNLRGACRPRPRSDLKPIMMNVFTTQRCTTGAGPGLIKLS